MAVTKPDLLPTGCHQKANKHDSKADRYIPGSNRGDGPTSSRYVVHQNPCKTQKHQAEHHRLEPRGVVVGLLIRRAVRQGITGAF